MGHDRPKITVVGSSNMDLVVKASRIPAVGETILGGDFIMVPGGKGANQAVAAARLGAEVFFVARLGRDIFATHSLANFDNVGVNTRYVFETDDAPSGVALIMVDEKGNNSIVVAPGANSKLTPDDVEAAKGDIASSGALVAQLEVPIETIDFTSKLAESLGVPFVLDPAPAFELSSELLARVSVLTPNESEAQLLTGIEVTDETSACSACEVLLSRGVKAVILTMGERGYMLADGDGARFVASHEVEAVDSTAAGDAFTGSLAVGIAQGETLVDAAEYANCIAALSVTKMGAQPSMPTKQEVTSFMEKSVR